MKILVNVALAAACLGVGLSTSVAQAQKFPSGDIRVLVGAAPGGGTDQLARLVASSLQNKLGVSVVVENRPGAIGQTAGQYVSRQPADGKTLMVATSSTILVGPHLQAVFDPIKELTAISLLTRFQGVLTVAKSSPFKSVQDVVEAARKTPGKLTYATSGVGSLNHLAAEMLETMAKIDMTHVPYSGSGPAVIAVLGGHADMTFAAVQSIMQQVRSGEMRALGVDSVQRSPVLPDVPTIRESGYPEYGLSNWIGMFAPPGMAPEMIAEVRSALADAMKSPEIQKYAGDDGQTIVVNTPDEFRAEIKTDYEKMGTLVKSLNLKPPQ